MVTMCMPLIVSGQDRNSAARVDFLPPETLKTTGESDFVLMGVSTGPLSEGQFLERLSVLYTHQADLMAAIARDDRDAAVLSLDRAMTEISDLVRRPDMTGDPRFADAYRMVVSEYERFYGPADTLFVAFGDIFELRNDMFAALEETRDPLLEDVVPAGIQPVGTTVPMTMNRLVESSMEYLKRNDSSVLKAWLQRADTYFPMVEQIFAEEGVPDELKYLGMIESGLNPRARSWAAAVGMWQFVAATGRAYDLNVNAWVDDRMDPELATRAAARHLKDLYRQYDGDWQVALAGYNCSYRCIRRAQRNAQNRGISEPDYWDIYPYLPRETRNYVPMFIATALMASNPAQFGVEVSTPGPQYAYHVVPVTGMLAIDDIARLAGTDAATIKALNPSLKRDALPPSTGPFYLRLPLGSKDSFAAAYEALPPSARRPSGEYIIKRGDTLSQIASEFGVSLSLLMQKNGLTSSRINIGQRLVVPIADYTTDISSSQFADTERLVQYPPRMTRPILMEQTRPAMADATPSLEETPVVQASTRASEPEGADGPESDAAARTETPAEVRVVHTVRRGDTLSGLATQYGVGISSIRGWNNMSSSRINVGQRLTIFTDGRAAPATPNEPVTYVVKRGDTLSEIAASHSVRVTQLRQWNDIRGSNIRIGQELKIYPDMARTVTHTVQRGDTLIGIAQRFGVSVANIKDWNSLRSNTIRVGQQLRIFQQ